ncbi:pyridoxal phosphate-dependent transferase [Flagelloscypha sp. PMI_526]|nr:pyridoxal phosphate-dependent transferase [Flagelloscypha sp. PMI_526]
MAARVTNFGAGPSQLPESVLEEAAKGLFNFNGTGIGIAEISHRSKEFSAFLEETCDLIREQLQVPSTHSVLLTQGGGTGQFSAVVLNLLARHKLLYPTLPDEDVLLDYVVTGSWSKKASEEAKRLVGPHRVHIAVDSRPYSPDAKSFNNIPTPDKYSFSPTPALIYYCDNETVDGVQFSDDPTSPNAFPFDLLQQNALLPLVGDYSSSFMSKPIPRLADHAVIYAGAQKNLGPAGLTILIVRQDCLVNVDGAAALGAIPVPISMSYKTLADNRSLYNTPPTLSVYITGLVLRRMKELGGVAYYQKLSKVKADKLYAVLKEGEQAEKLKIKVASGSQSSMNVVFDVIGEGKMEEFLAGAEERNMKALKGHRFFCIRASLYNAVTEEQTDQLVAYIKDFLSK